MARITFIYGNQVKTVEGENGNTLLQIGLSAGVPIEHACGGNGFCTTCMCKITKGMEQLSPRNEREENMGVTEDPHRLTCQARLAKEGEVEVEVPE